MDLQQPPTFTSGLAPDGVINTPYTHTFAAGGNDPITFSTNDMLPDGLTLVGDTLSGTPTVGGTFSGTVTATNDAGNATQAFSIFIATPPAFTSAAPVGGMLNTPYTHTFTADGDTPITYEVTSGALPDGLSISGDQITGTPTLVDTFTGEITATNAVGTDTQAFSITIVPDNAVPVAVDDSYTATLGQTLNATTVLVNDTDADQDDILTAVLDQDVSQGSLTLNLDGTFLYTPNLNAIGTDTFTYFANDGTADSATVATVTITITDPAGTPPRLYPADGATLTENNAADWPQFSFRHLDGVEWYGLWIGTDTTTAIYEWFPATATSAGITSETPICDTQTMICTLPTDVFLGDGQYSWWMTYWGPTFPDWGTYWNGTTFNVDFDSPATGALSNVTPSGTVNTTPTEVTWDRDPNVLWMEIWLGQVVGPEGTAYTAFYDWVDATEICDATTCTLTPDEPVIDGDYEMWMRLWGPGGFLEWTDVNGNSPAASFSVDTSSN